MISVHVYGKLRRFAADRDARSDSVLSLPCEPNDTVASVIDRIGIPRAEIGSNIFRNGRYADFDTPISDGDRLGLFPDDMQLLYKWLFDPNRSGTSEAATSGSEAET